MADTTLKDIYTVLEQAKANEFYQELQTEEQREKFLLGYLQGAYEYLYEACIKILSEDPARKLQALERSLSTSASALLPGLTSCM